MCRSNVRSWSEFQHRSIKSLLFNCGVGVGMATFSGLYSAVLHLDFILALPSTSSDCHVYLTAICKKAFCRGGGVRRTPAPQARRRREQPVWENVCCEPFTELHNHRAGGGWEFKLTNLTWISRDIFASTGKCCSRSNRSVISLGWLDYTWLRNQPFTIRFEFVIRVFKRHSWFHWLKNNKYIITYSWRHHQIECE